MRAPIIGMTDMGTGMAHHYMQSKYMDCLHRAGASVLVLSCQANEETMESYLNSCDGFLFPGGADIEPTLYGKARLEACGKPNQVRDNFELPFLRMVLKSRKPLFCICRGCQLLNVACEGTLLQDIKHIQYYKHSNALRHAGIVHRVKLKSSSRLAHILGQNVIGVNSLHHQVIDVLGNGLSVAAYSPEGFVEAVELKNYPFSLAVQWHPEHMVQNFPIQQKLFDSFIAACR